MTSKLIGCIVVCSCESRLVKSQKSEYREFCLACNLLYKLTIIEMALAKDSAFKFFFFHNRKWKINLKYIYVYM